MVKTRSGFEYNFKNQEETYPTFDEWKSQINNILYNDTGWYCDDIVDFAYMDYYNSGLRPNEVYNIINNYFNEIYDIYFN